MVSDPKPSDMIRMGINLITNNLCNSRYYSAQHSELISEVEQAWVDAQSDEDIAFYQSVLNLLRSV